MEVKDSYWKGLCPDCQTKIPIGAPEGWNCPNCGHACYSVGEVPISNDEIEDLDKMLEKNKTNKTHDEIMQMIAETLSQVSGKFLEDIANRILTQTVVYKGDSIFEVKD